MRLFIALLMTVMAIPAAAQERGKQAAQSLEKPVTKIIKIKYLLYLPNEYGRDAARKWPLVLFLHGAGESGDDLEKVKAHGPPKLVAEGREAPFIVVSPQSARGGWDVEALDVLLNEVTAKYNVDLDRIIVTGLSIGGFGTWNLAMEFPNRFAAIAPICGGGNARRARSIRHIPTWVFHGAKDTAVPLKASQDMVDALKAAGGEPKFTIYPEAGHDSWTEAYNDRALWEWFEQQRRKVGTLPPPPQK